MPSNSSICGRRSRSPGRAAGAAKGKLAIAANEFTALSIARAAEFRRHIHDQVTMQRSLGTAFPTTCCATPSKWACFPTIPKSRACILVVYLDELTFVVPPTHPLAGESRLASVSLGRKCLSPTSFHHPTPKKYRTFAVSSSAALDATALAGD
jgi:hypothetical protein